MGRPAKWSRPASVLFPGVLGFLVALASAAQGGGACEGDENYRALDFMLGEWQLVSGGEVVGRSRVEKLEDGCLIAETWSFLDGRGGRTYSSFDRAAGVWRRFGVSNRGLVVRSSGVVDGGALLLRGERVSADGEASNWRERWVPEAGGRIRRSAGGSVAEGTSAPGEDALFDDYYEPVGRPVTASSAVAPPAEAAAVESPSVPDGPAPPRLSPEPVVAPAAPEPVASEPEAPKARTAEERVAPDPVFAAAESESPAPAAGDVTPASARAANAGSVERIAMASPMVLRLPLGPIEALPGGYAWITRDTAPYLCEGVTIERLEVAQRRRRGQVELEAALAVHGRQISRAVDVSVELHRAGQPSAEAVVASGSASSRVGRSIPEQVQYGSVAVVVTLAMTEEVFDSVVAEPERPDLLITLVAED